jgi:hypothetical protein
LKKNILEKKQYLFNHLHVIKYHDTKRRREGNAGKKSKESNKEKNR